MRRRLMKRIGRRGGPPRRHTGETYVMIRTTERVLAGTEIRWDYDMGGRERPYRAQLQAAGVSSADLDGAAYKRVRWARPTELKQQQDAAACARRAGHTTDTQRAGVAGGDRRAAGQKRRNLQSRWEGGTGAPGTRGDDGTQPQQGPTKRRRGGEGWPSRPNPPPQPPPPAHARAVGGVHKSHRALHKLGGPPLRGASGAECLSIAAPTRARSRSVESI